MLLVQAVVIVKLPPLGAQPALQTLLATVISGDDGGVQAPGAVVTELVGLDVLLSASQLQRVNTVIAVV